MPTVYNGQGEDVIDEVVALTTSITIGATTYYEGRLEQWHAPSVYGSTDPDYGAWSAASKGGTRFRVNELADAAVPTDSDTGTGSPPDLTLDPASGVMRSTVSQSVYVRYVGLGEHVVASAPAAASAFPYVIAMPIPAILPTGVELDHYIEAVAADVRLTHYQIIAPPTGGLGPAGTDATLKLRDYLDGGSGESRDIVLGVGDTHTGWVALSSPLEVSAGGLLVIHGDGKDSENIVVKVRHVPA